MTSCRRMPSGPNLAKSDSPAQAVGRRIDTEEEFSAVTCQIQVPGGITVFLGTTTIPSRM